MKQPTRTTAEQLKLFPKPAPSTPPMSWVTPPTGQPVGWPAEPRPTDTKGETHERC